MFKWTIVQAKLILCLFQRQRQCLSSWRPTNRENAFTHYMDPFTQRANKERTRRWYFPWVPSAVRLSQLAE